MRKNIDSSSSIGIISAGRLGCSLALALIEEKYNLVAISSSKQEVKEVLKKISPSIGFFEESQKVVDSSKIIFMTSNDDNILPIVKSLILSPEKYLIHCSGFLPLDVLNKNKIQVKSGNFHPIQTFPNITSNKNFREIFFSIESSDLILEDWLRELATKLNSDVINISSEDKNLYHAICVLNCGLIASLITHSSKLWEHIGIDSETGIKISSPMIKTTLQSILNFGSFESITGPLIRGDLETIKKHIKILEEFSEDSKKVYMLLSSLILDIDKDKLKLPEMKLNKIKQILYLND